MSWSSVQSSTGEFWSGTTATGILLAAFLCAAHGESTPKTVTRASYGTHSDSVSLITHHKRKALLVSKKTKQGPLTRFNSPEILERLRGNKITPDPEIRQHYVDFTEEFLPDGTWVTHRTERGPIVRTGKWEVRNNEVCVSLSTGKSQCRKVWVHLSSGKIALTDVGSRIGTIIVMAVSQRR
jgi:hypothetical protein